MPKKIIFAGAGLTGNPVTITGLPGTPLEGQSKSVLAWGEVPQAGTLLAADGGRIQVVDEAITNLSAGVAIPRADGKTTLNFRDVKTQQTVTGMWGAVPVIIEVSAAGQADGFGSGEGYWLAQDENGRFVTAVGERHRLILVSASPTAMTKAMIAAHAGVSESAVTSAWIAARPVYGSTPDMALAWDAFTLLAIQLYGHNKEPRSDHIYFERGYQYEKLRLTPGAHQGESELHPLCFGAYGSGPWPEFDSVSWSYRGGQGPKHTLIRDLRARSCYQIGSVNVAFEGGQSDGGSHFEFRECNGLTFKDYRIVDHKKVAPTVVPGPWVDHPDRISGSYISISTNVIFDGGLVDLNGYGEDYDINKSSDSPQPPSKYNHGLYWEEARNAVLRDMIVSRSASCGFQNRTGTWSERILFLYNNIAYGGDAEHARQFTVVSDSIVMGSGHKETSSGDGAVSVGLDLGSRRAVAIGCIVAHDADPNNPAERAARPKREFAYKGQAGTSSSVGSADWAYNDTIVDNWNGIDERRILPFSQTKEITIQRRAQALLSDPTADQNDFYALARQESTNIKALTKDTAEWIKAGFGDPIPAAPAGVETKVFQPHPFMEGLFWWNRRNWNGNTIPKNGDTVDLDGNKVRFNLETVTGISLRGSGGLLDVCGGYLGLATALDAVDLSVRRAGRISLGETAQPVRVTADSGLTMLTGAVSNLDLIARGHSRFLLGPDAAFPSDKKLLVNGPRTLVGWDGSGNATCSIAGILEFRVGLLVTVNTGTKAAYLVTGQRIIGQGWSATIADYVEQSLGNNNRLWLCDVEGTPTVGATFTYGDDSLGNSRQEHTATIYSVTPIITPLQRFRSGFIGDGKNAPDVMVSLPLLTGSGVIVTGEHLVPAGMSFDLSTAGITATDEGTDLGSGVSLSEGKLTYTKPEN